MLVVGVAVCKPIEDCALTRPSVRAFWWILAGEPRRIRRSWPANPARIPLGSDYRIGVFSPILSGFPPVTPARPWSDSRRVRLTAYPFGPIWALLVVLGDGLVLIWATLWDRSGPGRTTLDSAEARDESH